MTVTGDWTMVKEEMNNAESPDRDEDSTAKSVSALMEGSDTLPPKRAAVRFPCLEQPPRYALRSSNGFYLGGTKKGRVVGRKKRSEQDEWVIAFVRGTEDDSNAAALEETGASASAVTIHNHKFGSVLSMVISNKSDMGRMVACVAPRGNEEEKESPKENDNGNGNDLGLGEEAEAEKDSNGDGESPAEQLPDDEIEDGDADGEAKILLPKNADAGDLQWSVVRIAGDDTVAKGGVRIVSRKTGDSLGMSDAGAIVLVDSKDIASSYVWTMECVTGELCFLSNPTLDVRVRCDMPGILTLSPNWKGWEVVRITEVAAPHSGNNNSNDDSDAGYVRISSWMHSQWFLCSDASGEVSTCSVAESLADPVIGGPGIVTGEDCCSKWAIERYPTDEESKHEGVILRSVTHGRLLSIKDGLLRTYDSREGFRFAGSARASASASVSADAEEIGDEKSTAASTTTTATTTTTTSNSSAANLVKHHADEMKRMSMELKQNGSRWWKQSLTNVQKTLSDSAIQRRNSKLMAAGASPISPAMRTVVPQEETIVWQLEAAHLQTYYFLSAPTTKEIPMTIPQNDNDAAEAPPISVPARSIGAFPNVTEHLRKSDKIQLLRNDDTPDTLKLYLPDEQFYISCSSKGSVVATNKADCEGTEWVLEERAECSVFRSHAHGLYLSLRDQDAKEKAPPAAAFPPSPATNVSEHDTNVNTSTTNGNNDNDNGNDNDNAARPSPRGRFSNPFESLQEKFQKSRGPVAESPDNENDTTNDNSPKAKVSSRGKPKNAFENLHEKFQTQKAPIAELCATEVFEASKCCWKLEPCTPRAISSKRLTTFAIGTSIAVGTTIAMPFALAGVAAVMGTLGAEAGIGFGIVAAGLSGAEAMASVGAIGATAYFCFKPEENSLGDGIGEDGNDSSSATNRNPWSKRPFGNWRNW